MAGNLDTILSFFTAKGLSPAQAAGIAGNFQVESGLSPTAYNPREGAIGLAQWEGGRRTALDSYAAATGGSETDLNTQLGFAWQELHGSESGAFQRLLQVNDPGTAATVFDQFYERSSGSARAARVSDAQTIYAGGVPAGSATASPAGFTATNVGVLPSVADWQSMLLKVGGGAIAGVLVVVGLKDAMRGTAT